MLLVISGAGAYDATRCDEFVAGGHCSLESSAAYMERHCSGWCTPEATEKAAAALASQSTLPEASSPTTASGSATSTPGATTQTIPGSTCEPWCEATCAELNGDVVYECGGCTGLEHTCRPGAPGFPGADASPSSSDVAAPRQSATVSASGDVSGGAGAFDAPAVARPASARSLAAMQAWADEQAATRAARRNVPDVVDAAATCTPFLRTLGSGKGALRVRACAWCLRSLLPPSSVPCLLGFALPLTGVPRCLQVCPVLNGLWTSFHDRAKWPEYSEPLPKLVAEEIVTDMQLYDAVGLSTWIGEDFDERVLSTLEAHRARRAQSVADPPAALSYSIIVERGRTVIDGLNLLKSRLGVDALKWVQLGPPALDNLPEVRAPTCAYSSLTCPLPATRPPPHASRLSAPALRARSHSRTSTRRHSSWGWSTTMAWRTTHSRCSSALQRS